MMIKNRLSKNLRRLKGWINDQKIEAFRLYEKDIPEYPYLIDIYGDFIILYEKGTKDTEESLRLDHQNEITTALNELFPQKEIVIKERESLTKKNEYSKKSSENYKFTIKENSLNFNINPYDYIDVGLFLDHRPLRKKVLSLNPKNVLNLFCYTSSFSVYSASLGAKTTNVDLSQTYLNWSQMNFKSNDLDMAQHQFIKSDVISFLKSNQDKYDLIILDPPSFSNSKSMDYTFSVQNHHQEMVKFCMEFLLPKGTLFFSGNLRSFKFDESLENNYLVKNITEKTIPIDFRDKKIHFCYEIKHKEA